MSTYTEFESKFLVGSYLLSEELSKEIVDVRDVLAKFPLGAKPNWIRRAISSFTDSGFAKGRMHMGPEEDQHVWLTAHGIKEAERLLENGVVSIRLPNDRDEEEPDTPSIDSSSWTGLAPGFVLTDERRARLVDLLRIADRELDSMVIANSEKAQARAYIMAAQGLAEAPDPPVDLIWEILNRANSLAGIASLFVAIVALFS